MEEPCPFTTEKTVSIPVKTRYVFPDNLHLLVVHRLIVEIVSATKTPAILE